MQGQRLYESTIPEQTVIRIMRKLSPERVSDLVDYARFLEFRATERYQDWLEAAREQDDPSGAADQRWEELLARPAARQLMRQMAQEAREDYLAGRTTEIVETEDGQLAPE